METAVIVGFIFLAILATSVSFQISGGTVGGGSAPPLPGFPDNTPAPGGAMGANAITNDPGTWPSSDIIWMVCCAIASAEGADQAGSFADRNNNPGNISDGHPPYSATTNVVDGEQATVFPDKGTGWQWLYNKVQNIQRGNSTVYPRNATWIQLGHIWATKENDNWGHNVAAFLGVSPNSKFSDYTG